MAKQLKINTLFKKKGISFQTTEDCDDVVAEIQQLEQNLKQMQIQLIQAHRNALKRKSNHPKKKDEEFMRPQKIVVKSSIEHLKRNLDLYTMLTGMEVKSYVKDEHCCVVYHMQHSASHFIQHGLTINLENVPAQHQLRYNNRFRATFFKLVREHRPPSIKLTKAVIHSSSRSENSVSKYSLPIGFNYNAVMEDYDTVMTPECLRAVRKALIAYYDRLKQVNDLQKLLSSRVSILKIMDGSHLELSFTLHLIDNTDEEIDVILMLDYRVYDIRPKNYSFRTNGMSSETIEVLKGQCISFKRETLSDAFRQSFLEGPGPYIFLDESEAMQKSFSKRPARRERRTDFDEDYDPYKDA